jgi:MYXO-CTERM domain-containing protein
MRLLALLALAAPGVALAGSGSVALTDGFGLTFYVNDDITYSTTSSASGAASEASFSTSIAASTAEGGSTAMGLGDAYDGYNALYVNDVSFNQNGASTLECGDRQVVYGVQAIGTLEVTRKVYVPEADGFIRWMNVVTNVGGAAESVVVRSYGNLGSDSGTQLMASSSGDATVDTSDDWAVSMASFSGYYSYDPRLAHVWQNALGAVRADSVSLADYDDSHAWQHSFTLAAGETAIVLYYGAGTGFVTDAQDMAEYVSDLPVSAVACMTDGEFAQVVNFGVDCSSLSDSCSEGSFDVATGTCVASPINEGGSCDDGTTCTVDDVCGAGTCGGAPAPETVGDGVDADCDGVVNCYADADQDGFRTEGTVASSTTGCTGAGEALASVPSGDCDDANNEAYPGATEALDDGVDQDCDGEDSVTEEDTDTDIEDTDTDTEDTDTDTEDTDTEDTDTDEIVDEAGCGCSAPGAPQGSALALAFAVSLLARRRRN